MKTHSALQILAFSAVAHGRPMLGRREVPQEHSHQMVLTSVQASLQKNNPAGIKDSVFGLLDNAAGSAGQGAINNTDCLQQATADQAFSNAKAASDVVGMTMALIYRALERNTGKVGKPSVNCTSIRATNSEVAAVWQHQDPASPGAAANNKAVTLALARQIQAIGGNATSALLASTFARGNLSDATAKGNSCNNASDPIGCAFTKNLMVPDATLQEIRNATSGVTNSSSTNATAIVSALNATATAPRFSNNTSVLVNGTTTSANSTNASTNSTIASANSTSLPTNGTLGSSSSSCSAQQSGSNLNQGNRNGTTQNGRKGSKSNGNVLIAEQISTETIVVGGQVQQITQITEAILGQLTSNGKAGRTPSSPAAAPGCGPSTASISNATSTTANSTTAAMRPMNLGSCTNAKIVFAPGLDGRKENSFQPANLMQFSHGSTLDIGTTTSFMMDRLKNTCKAPQATLDRAAAASVAASTEMGQTAADAWNKVMGGV